MCLLLRFQCFNTAGKHTQTVKSFLRDLWVIHEETAVKILVVHI